MMASSLLGFDIVVSPDVARYVLPAEVLPGVPWPPGFRDSINAWARDFCGTTNFIPDGEVMFERGRRIYVNPRTAAAMRNSFKIKNQGLL